MFNMENFDIAASLAGTVPFIGYFLVATILTLVFKTVYVKFTPYNEIELIKNQNTAAAISFTGAMIGFALPMTTAMTVSVNVIDFVMWGVIAMIVQLAVYQAVKIRFPLLSERIQKGEIAMALFLAGVSITFGLLNSAAMID